MPRLACPGHPKSWLCSSTMAPSAGWALFFAVSSAWWWDGLAGPGNFVRRRGYRVCAGRLSCLLGCKDSGARMDGDLERELCAIQRPGRDLHCCWGAAESGCSQGRHVLPWPIRLVETNSGMGRLRTIKCHCALGNRPGLWTLFFFSLSPSLAPNFARSEPWLSPLP
jgi:hypothetical protein